MLKLEDNANCCGCGTCEKVCPKKCIKLQPDKEGFLYPIINESQCINCGICEKFCPIIKPVHKKGQDVKAYAAYNNNPEIRMRSSSGGLFTILASHIIQEGGIVYGAAFDDKFKVEHCGVECESGLIKFQGSKYVQSNKRNVFVEIKSHLSNERKVLFSGTPCEINGLYKFLNNKNIENLYTCDFICHGVPSPKVWEKYKKYIENHFKSKIINVSHRDKRYGWKTYSMSLNLLNTKGKEFTYNKILTFDPYIQAFLRDISLRPSCYECKFKGIYRLSDITLGDFWGIRRILPAMNDDKGISLLLIQSEKGTELFNNIKKSLTYTKVNLDNVVKINKNILVSPPKPHNRKAFFDHLTEYPFDVLYKRYIKNNYLSEILNMFKGYIKLLLHYMNI